MYVFNGKAYARKGFSGGSYSTVDYPIFGYGSSATVPSGYFRQDNTSGNILELGGNGGVLRLSFPEGGGIKFPATSLGYTSTNANNLDAYEEGSSTLSSGTANVTVTNSTSPGLYWVKIGQFVYGTAYIAVTNNTGAPIFGFQINGLPFTCNPGFYGGVFEHYNGAYPNAAGYGYVQASATYFLIGLNPTALANGATGNFMFSMVYRAST